jgi:hypothetical protein
MAETQALAAELAALVDMLVPGDHEFPSASAVGAQAKLADRLIVMRGADALAELVAVLNACGGPLAALDPAGRSAVLERFERERPEQFLQLRNLAYLSYYDCPAVHDAIRALGFTYHAAPLPEGYDVGRFDRATDMPRHGRGNYVRTEEVRRVDLAQLEFLGGRHG